MKKLNNFVSDEWGKNPQVSLIKEYRTAKKKDDEAPELKDVQGKDEDENGSGGVYSIDAPTEDELLEGIDKDTLNKNKKMVLKRLLADKPFFIQGEAGWGKTSVIVDTAKRLGKHVITVFLDKCEATDLGGIPVPAKSKKGADYVKHLLPEWAKIMFDNPKTDFLLFFDEMNQAAPDVMNALMPIVLKTEICGLKFENFVVGAAGNFEDENDAVNELSKPLLSRFGGIITWESGDWDNAFAHLRKKWKDKVSEDFIDDVAAVAPDLFKNPRDVESFIIENVFKMKGKKNADLIDVEEYLDDLKNLAKTEAKENRSGQEKLSKLAEKMYNFVNNKTTQKAAAGSRKDREMIPDKVKEMLRGGITKGYIAQREDPNNPSSKLRKYGISRENIYKIEMWDFPREMLERTINKLEADGAKFKYEKDKEWQDAGYEDPNAD